jgi:4-hydroxybenzoate polyprenyltransferase
LPLYAGCVAWTMVYDTVYAHQDAADDAKLLLNSTAVAWGSNSKIYMAAFNVVSACFLTAAGVTAGLSWPYFVCCIGGSSYMLARVMTTELSDARACGATFKAANVMGALLLLGIVGSRLV